MTRREEIGTDQTLIGFPGTQTCFCRMSQAPSCTLIAKSFFCLASFNTTFGGGRMRAVIVIGAGLIFRPHAFGLPSSTSQRASTGERRGERT